MPAKHTIRYYVKGGIYHVYNRGVEKRDIFLTDHDYKIFQQQLADALLPLSDPDFRKKDVTIKGTTFRGVPRPPKNFHGKIELLAYCLMPNHFHLILRQSEGDELKKFMQSLITRYSIYFNAVNKRTGALFGGRYKARLILDEPQLLHLTRLVHRYPEKQANLIPLSAYSSYGDYLGIRKTPWLNTAFVLSLFHPDITPLADSYSSYREFVERFSEDPATAFADIFPEDFN